MEDSERTVRSLDLLACHLVGDFVLQTPEQAAEKLQNPSVRAAHVTTYHLPFLMAGVLTRANLARLVAFLILSWAAHFATDSRRWIPGESPWLSIVNDQALHAVQLTVLNRLLGRTRY